jgi:DNA polymerase-4
VAACSYEARVFGIHSGMPSAKAYRLCPQAIFVRGGHGQYGKYSRQVRGILHRYAPVVQPASIDEFYLDFTGTDRMYPVFVDVARRIKSNIRGETGLPCTIGLATNKLVAKVAAGEAKPDGLMEIAPGDEAAFMGALPIAKLPGIGKVTQERLGEMGIRTLGQLTEFGERQLVRMFGRWGAAMLDGARGISHSVVHEPGESGSMSHETTFGEDTTDMEYLDSTLVHLVALLGTQLRERRILAGGVGMKLRYSDFRTYTRSMSIEPTSRDSDLLRAVRAMFGRMYTRRIRVRLMGVRVERFCPDGEQFELFGYRVRSRERTLSECVDEIRGRFGDHSIRPGHALTRKVRRGA